MGFFENLHRKSLYWVFETPTIGLMTMPLYIEIIGVDPPDRTYGEKPVNFLFGHHLEAIEFRKHLKWVWPPSQDDIPCWGFRTKPS